MATPGMTSADATIPVATAMAKNAANRLVTLGMLAIRPCFIGTRVTSRTLPVTQAGVARLQHVHAMETRSCD